METVRVLRFFSAVHAPDKIKLTQSCDKNMVPAIPKPSHRSVEANYSSSEKPRTHLAITNATAKPNRIFLSAIESEQPISVVQTVSSANLPKSCSKIPKHFSD
ncbi:hypothetical protein T265_04216 [Opisthorchis viverrini]|uniref:Uncharacterized protein n=1 Tax=Opisthorchis viverrini TaxID=6198 RepID=A0A074ZT66_OPIVI|nr:hypothetical protein T265_04216 [Opisthorchis viverrini]KER29027.1 hypothetical protein T265_04216 [Opisthorchis viverrini]